MYINVIYLLHKYILGFYLVIQKAKQLRLALNGNTPNQIEKILFLIMNFRFSCLSWISSTLTEFRQMNSVPKASICSLSGMNAVQKFALLGLSMNLMQGRKQDLLEIFRFRSIWRNDEGCVMDCFKIIDFSQLQI